MRTLKPTKATLSFISIVCCLTGLVAVSKTELPTVLKDVKGLREVSPRIVFPQPTLQERYLVDGQVKFGFKLFSTLTESQENENILIAPTSIALTLSMLYNGATGATQTEIAQGLYLKNVSANTLNRANQNLYNDLNSHELSSSFIVNNSLWAKEGFPFRYQFRKNSRNYYQAKITNLDFSSSEARGIVNRWVTEETQGQVRKIMDSTQADDVLFLINTATFQGRWKRGFDSNLTKDKPFYLKDQSVKNYPFMSRQGVYNYLETPQLQAAELPYGNGRFSLYLFLPKAESDLPTILEEIKAKKSNKLFSKFRKSQGLLELPRFRLNDEVNLTDALKKLGFSTMFAADKAEFSQLSSHSTYISGMKHQTILTINENGVNSSTQNDLSVQKRSKNKGEKEFSLKIDRPFLSIIRDNKTGNILFMGMIFEP